MSEIVEAYYEKRRKNRTLPLFFNQEQNGCERNHSLPIEILISKDTHALGTAGAVKNAEQQINSHTFFVLNGDSFCPVNLTKFLNFHRQKEALLSLVVTFNKNSNDYGQIILDENSMIQQFSEKGQDGSGLISAGIYLVKKETLKWIPAAKTYSFEWDLFPRRGPICLGSWRARHLLEGGQIRSCCRFRRGQRNRGWGVLWGARQGRGGRCWRGRCRRFGIIPHGGFRRLV